MMHRTVGILLASEVFVWRYKKIKIKIWLARCGKKAFSHNTAKQQWGTADGHVDKEKC